MNQNQFQALSIFAFPVILAIGILTIPVVSDYSNHALAEQAASHTTRWFWGHVISAVAFGFGVLAACSIVSHLSRKGQRLAKISLPFIVIGAALHSAGLGADGVGPLAITAAGGQAKVFFDGSGMWIRGIFITASVTFGVGLISQVIWVRWAGMLTGTFRVLVLIAAIIFIAAEAIPSGWGLYVVAAAALVVYIPISIAIWREPASENSHDRTAY